MDNHLMITNIRAAFSDPGWPVGKPAHVGPEGDLDCAYIRDHYQGKRWCELTHEELGWMSQDGWAFTDEALRYFLPAWMVDDLTYGWDHVERLSTYLNHQWDAICTSFTIEQKTVLLDLLLIKFPERDWPSPDTLIGALLKETGSEDLRPEGQDFCG